MVNIVSHTMYEEINTKNIGDDIVSAHYISPHYV